MTIIDRLRMGGPNAGEVGPQAADLIERLREGLKPFGDLRDDIAFYAAKAEPGTPEANPENWFKVCSWQDLNRVHILLKEIDNEA